MNQAGSNRDQTNLSGRGKNPKTGRNTRKETRPKKFLEGLTGENKKTLQRTKDTQRSLYTGEFLTDCEQVMVMELGQ